MPTSSLRTRWSLAGALTLVASLTAIVLPQSPAHAAPTNYVTLSDGTEIAINVKVPEQCTATHPCPTVFEMSGYESGSADGSTPAGDLAELTGLPLPLQGGTRAAHGAFFDDEYVTVFASLRGTGCSTGTFDLFSWRSALDGKEVIDDWIAEQPWSNGDVAIYGHSYSGITGTMIAATRPEHLRVASVSGLIGDLYRDIVYPGGVTNYGFPLLWTGAIRPAYDYGGGVGGGLFPPADTSAECGVNQASKSRATLDDPLLQGLSDTDSEWYRVRSLVTWINRIDVPVHVTTAYQDEQTGPRGGTNVFDHLPDTISKRLVITNGDHGTQEDEHIRKDRLAWIDYWMLGRNHPGGKEADAFPDGNLVSAFGPRERATTTSRVILGYQDDGSEVGEIHSDGFPYSQTRFRDLYLSSDGTMTFDRQQVVDGSVSYVNGSRRQAYSYQAGKDQGGPLTAAGGPDEADFTITFDEPTVIAGPMTATLNVDATSTDTELFVQLVDRAPSGEELFLQRGMLKASHRAIDASASDRTASGRIYRTWRPHTNPQPIVPGRTYAYLVELFPVGHVFLPGHQLVVKVHAPPLDDNDYSYVPKTTPGVNTIHTSTHHPSSLMLPTIPLKDVAHLDLDVAPCAYHQMRCVTPAG